jgi:hypothetical protein
MKKLIGWVLLPLSILCSDAFALTLNTGPVATATTEGINRVIWCVAENLTTKSQEVVAALLNGKGEVSYKNAKTLEPGVTDWIAGWNASSGGGLTHCRFALKTNKVRAYLQVQENYVTTVTQEAR